MSPGNRMDPSPPTDRLFLKERVTLLAPALALLACGCVHGGEVPCGEMGAVDARETCERITISVEVASYAAAAIHDDFLDGTHAAFDLAVLTVLAPEPYRGMELHVTRPGASSPGRTLISRGQRCQVSIAPWAMDPAVLIPLDTLAPSAWSGSRISEFRCLPKARGHARRG